jgi:uncharacterized ion transporter superfamily protein YfcC
MNEAQAHDAIFPHVHPHPAMSAFETAAGSLLFVAMMVALARGLSAIARRARD